MICPPAATTLSEASVAGWSQGALTCTGVTDTDGDPTDASITFLLAAGQTISCAITNTQGRYDLALNKVYTSDDHDTTNDGVVAAGALVTFTITVTNQGNIAASNVVVTDYLPSGFTFPSSHPTNVANGWSLVGGLPTATIASLTEDTTPGDTVVLALVLEVAPTAMAGALVNFAEISSDDGDDVDSTPNTDNTDDPGGQSGSPADDFLDGDGTGTPGDGVAATDEDDHDPAEVTVEGHQLLTRQPSVARHGCGRRDLRQWSARRQ